MFVKHGEGKIVSVFEEQDLDENQKKAVKNLSDKAIKESSKEDMDNNKKLES